MARSKDGRKLKPIKIAPPTIYTKSRPDWGHKAAALAALAPENDAYATPREMGRNGVIPQPCGGFRIDDATGRTAIAQFRQPAGTPSYFEVFGKDKPTARTLGENILIIRAWMHLEGHPPIPVSETVSTFATVSARFMLPRYKWPLFSDAEKAKAEAFIAEHAGKLYSKVAGGKTTKPQAILPGWAQPDRAAFYTAGSIATEQRFTRERTASRRAAS